MTGQSGRHLEARKAGEELFPQRAPKCRTGIEGAARAAQDVFLVCGARGRPYETFSERLSVPDIHFDVKPEILQRSEEHTSELQSLAYLVCRLLLEKKKNK